MFQNNGRFYLSCFRRFTQVLLILSIAWYLTSCVYVYLFDKNALSTQSHAYMNIKYNKPLRNEYDYKSINIETEKREANEKNFQFSSQNQTTRFLENISQGDEKVFSKKYNKRLRNEYDNKTMNNETEKKEANEKNLTVFFSKPVIPTRFLENISQGDGKVFSDESFVPDATFLKVDFLHLPPSDICKLNCDLIIAVKSTVDHFKQRKKIRITWGSNQSEFSVRVVFLLGLPTLNDGETTKQISLENSSYHDIIQGSFVDSYLNLTVKSLMGLRWFQNFCGDSKYFMLVDDDAYLDIGGIHSYYMNESLQSENILHCGDEMIMHAMVFRSGKWATPLNKYNFTNYPTYCGGVCYIMPSSVAAELHKTSLRTHTDIGVDDAMISGIVREKANIGIEKMPKDLCLNLINSLDIEKKMEDTWKRLNEKKADE